MKRTLFLLLCIIPLGIATQAQDYKPLLKPGRVWHYTETVHYLLDEDYPQDMPDEFERTFTVSVVGEAEDGNGVMLCKAYDNKGVDDALQIKDKYFRMSEKDKVVYGFWQPYGTMELYTMLDFNLKQGDIFNVCYEMEQGEEMHVVSEGSINVKGRIYRRLTIGSPEGRVVDSWVEGIGTKNRYVMTQMPVTLSKSSGGIYI